VTGTNPMFDPAQVDTDLALARRRAFAEILALLADLEGQTDRRTSRALVDVVPCKNIPLPLDGPRTTIPFRTCTALGPIYHRVHHPDRTAWVCAHNIRSLSSAPEEGFMGIHLQYRSVRNATAKVLRRPARIAVAQSLPSSLLGRKRPRA
jgi:hypothetical protein